MIAGALQSAFGLSAGGSTDVAYQSISNLFGNGVLIGTTAFPEEDAVPPKAFLNYILFDDDYVPYDFGYDQIGSNGAMPDGVDKMSLMAKVRKPGYIYIYLSNENEVAQEVYFDDLAIKHVKGVALQQNDYYPFGLTFNSYKRENSPENKFLYNQGAGKKQFKTERISDLGLAVDLTKFRGYDPAIGRWWQVDPLADESDFTSWSPYNYSFNNPVSYNDPLGDTPITPILRKLAPRGVKWAARTVKGTIKPGSRKQAVKILEKKGTVYQAGKGSNKVSKKLIKEAKPGERLKRHDGHYNNGNDGSHEWGRLKGMNFFNRLIRKMRTAVKPPTFQPILGFDSDASLRFKALSADVGLSLKELVLQISGSECIEEKELNMLLTNCNRCKDLNQVLQVIHSVWNADYSDNVIRSEKEGWDFYYFVPKTQPDSSLLLIIANLYYSPNELERNVLYNVVAIKTDGSSYFVWDMTT